MKRTLPSINWQNLAPPYYDYDYFRDHESYPFHPAAEEFDLVNAWWLAEVATLTYADEDFVVPRFQSTGFPDVRYFNGESTDCFVASNETIILVAFRGTESRPRSGSKDMRHIIADAKADCNVFLVDSGQSGKIHQGFQQALDEIWNELLDYLMELHIAPKIVWMTGHSLGAALAILAADRYKKVQGVYTFGSPRVGDKRFQEQFSISSYRVEYNNDIITALPPPGLYYHVGELCYIDSQGTLHRELTRMEMLADAIRGEVRNIMQTFESVSSGTFHFIPGGIKDHVPLFYTIHLWNALHQTVPSKHKKGVLA